MILRNLGFPIGRARTALALLLGVALAAAGCAPVAPVTEAPPPAPAAAAPAPAEATAQALPLWELTHEGRTLYLLGSVHLLRPDVYPLDEAIYAAFEEAEVVAFELDFDQMMAAAPMMMQRGTFDDGRTLRQVLPAEVYAELEAQVRATPLPMEAVERMKPWMASLALSSLVLQQGGFEAAAGIDLHFHERARAAGMEIIGLETMEDQIDVFEGMSEEAQVAMLRSTLEQLDETVAELDAATELWRRGDTEGLAAMFVEQMGDQEEAMERLLFARNRAWIPEIETLLERPQTAIVIVGVGHLAGEQNVIDLLRERGYEVRQVVATGSAEAAPGALRPDGMSSNAHEYLERALGIMQAQAMNRALVDWDQLRSDAFAAAKGAQEPRDTYRAIAGALAALGDQHSHFRPPPSAMPAGMQAMQPQSRPEPAARRVASRVGYVHVPQFGGPEPEAFATRISELIREIDGPEICGWIVDVRGNGGGNMWPMLQGLARIVGEGTPGYFVSPDSTWVPWPLDAGAIGAPQLAEPHPAVAVLHDGRTASSGEAVVVAFRGREQTKTFGADTRGLSTANSSIRLSDGAMMMLTVSVFADRDRTVYGGVISPDEAAMTEESDADLEARAAEWVMGQEACALATEPDAAASAHVGEFQSSSRQADRQVWPPALRG
jgi:uncharacterized protein YbaP (TraB family)